MDKTTPSELRAEAQRLISEGKMPALDDVLKHVAETREKYVPQVHEARKTNNEREE